MQSIKRSYNRLNAQYVGGESAAQLQSTGGSGITSEEADVALPTGVDSQRRSHGDPDRFQQPGNHVALRSRAHAVVPRPKRLLARAG
jgi:hypothetical protein